jgi:hypothetical protein
MELSLLIQHMKFKWKEYHHLSTPPHAGQNREEYLQSLTEQLAFTKMADVISQLESCVDGQNSPVTSNHIKLITSCFESHFDGIKSTNKVYFTSTDTPDTLLYLDIAKYLADSNLARGKNKYQLLAPSVVSWFNPIKSTNLASYPLHGLMLSDGNDLAMEVGFIESKPTKKGLVIWYNSDQLVEKSGKIRVLTKSERARVSGHSELLKLYYKARQLECQNNGEDTRVSDGMGQTIFAALNNEKYNGYKVTASYENCHIPGKLSGYPKLEAYLLDNLNRLFLNRQQLFDYMHSQLQPGEWEGFLAAIDPDILFNLIVGPDVADVPVDADKMTKLKQVLAAEVILDCEADYKKLIFFCLESVNWTLRAENPAEYTSKLINALSQTPISPTFFAYPKTKKGESDREMKNFLIGAPGYAGEKFKQQYLNPSVSDARNDGMQGTIFQLMCKHLNPVQTVKPMLK